jgi:mannose-1-phosphate guanylyltransferase
MQDKRPHGNTWAVVLAGGDGTRLATLTEALHSRPIPKQFACIAGRESLLQSTLRRVACVVPSRRTVVVVGRSHLSWARTQLGPRRGVSLLVQPSNLGTAAGLLYALSWIRHRDPLAHILMFPSDHHIQHLEPFTRAVRDAEDVSRASGVLTLIGVAPDVADADYGWIIPGTALPRAPARARELRGFIEKPDPEHAARLRAGGALWNTFILAAPATELWRLARQHVPVHAAAFEGLDRFSFSVGSSEIDEVYQQLPSADFSRHVLQVADRLAVVPMAGTGWSDWGTPQRVLASLRGTPAEAAIRARLQAAAPASRVHRIAPVERICPLDCRCGALDEPSAPCEIAPAIGAAAGGADGHV